MKTSKQAEQIIRKACQEAIDSGYEISSTYGIIRELTLYRILREPTLSTLFGTVSFRKKSCCPLGACDINGQSQNYLAAAKKILGWGSGRANAFANGFDCGNSNMDLF